MENGKQSYEQLQNEVDRLKGIISKLEAEKSQDELHKSLKKLSILYEVYRHTAENLDMSKLLSNALKVIKEAFLIDGIGIYITNQAAQTLSFESSIGFNEEMLKEIQEIHKQEGLSGRAIITRKPQFSNNIDYPEGKFKALLIEQGFRSMAAIPMIIGDKALGAISIAFRLDKYFADEEVQLLMAVSRQIGIAIQNAQLVDSLKHELLERMRIEQEMRNANEIINEKNKLLSEVMATLEVESKVDMLTGLYNRRHIMQKINEEISKFKVGKSNFSIIITDIDFFKKVNDTFGHAFGDYVLKSVSEILKSSLREQDCVSRWGGEEFLILLSDTDLKEAHILAERLRKNISENIFQFDSNSLSVTMTFGISIYNDEESVDDMIKKADDALYFGKNNGRNCVIDADK